MSLLMDYVFLHKQKLIRNTRGRIRTLHISENRQKERAREKVTLVAHYEARVCMRLPRPARKCDPGRQSDIDHKYVSSILSIEKLCFSYRMIPI